MASSSGKLIHLETSARLVLDKENRALHLFVREAKEVDRSQSVHESDFSLVEGHNPFNEYKVFVHQVFLVGLSNTHNS